MGNYSELIYVEFFSLILNIIVNRFIYWNIKKIEWYNMDCNRKKLGVGYISFYLKWKKINGFVFYMDEKIWLN